MASICESGYVEFNPNLNDSYDMELGEEIYVPSNYPFSIPKVFLEGSCETYYPQIAFDWTEDSIITVGDKILTKYTEHGYSELLAKDEDGNTIWVDGRTAPYEGCWKGTYLHKVCGVKEYDIEEIYLDTLEKKKYKVTLESTSKMDINDFYKYVDYIDPEIIKKISLTE